MALTALAIPSQLTTFPCPYDATLAFCSAQTLNATGYFNNLNSGQIDLGGGSPVSAAGRTDFIWSMDITTLDETTTDEVYKLHLFGYEPDDSPDLLPFNEVASGGGGAVTSSIYCVSFREGGFYAIEQTPLSVMPEGPTVGQPFDSTHIKWDYGFAREHPKALARLSSITNAAIVA